MNLHHPGSSNTATTPPSPTLQTSSVHSSESSQAGVVTQTCVRHSESAHSQLPGLHTLPQHTPSQQICFTPLYFRQKSWLRRFFLEFGQQFFGFGADFFGRCLGLGDLREPGGLLGVLALALVVPPAQEQGQVLGIDAS